MESKKFKNWIAILDLKTCLMCRMMHGKIYSTEDIVELEPPLHENCRCVIEWVKSLYAGTATKVGRDGADWWLKWIGQLPDNYITVSEAKQKGYNPLLGNLAVVAPGKMLTKGIYQNLNGHLPSAPGRVWYEADINYTQGFRAAERILFSNDGLIFVTYDHYKTFYAIV